LTATDAELLAAFAALAGHQLSGVEMADRFGQHLQQSPHLQ